MTTKPRTTTPVAGTEARERVIAAMTRLGPATVKDIAAAAGMAYSTLTPKLRALEADGHAQRVTADGATLWALAAAAPTGTPTDPPAANQPTEAAAAPPAVDAGATHDSDDAQPAATTLDTRPLGEAGAAPTDDRDADPADSAESPDTARPVEQADGADTGATTTAAATNRGKRPKGALRTSVLAVLRENRDRGLKVGEVARLVDRHDAGKGYPKASPGAVVLDLEKLVTADLARRTVDRPATYQAGPTD